MISATASGEFQHAPAQGEEVHRTRSQVQPAHVHTQRDAHQNGRHGHHPAWQIHRVSFWPPSFIEFIGRFALVPCRSCWEWDSTLRSIIAFVVFLLVTWYFEPFVLPLMLLFYFLHSFLVRLSFDNQPQGNLFKRKKPEF